MKRIVVLLVAALAALTACAVGAKGPAPADRPDVPDDDAPALPDEKAVPFGPAVSGLACRVIVPADVVRGQALTLTVQIKNVSDHDLCVLDELNPLFRNWVTLAITGPGGNPLWQTSGASRNLALSSFVKLAPGESRRFDQADLRDLFNGAQLEKEGRYSLTCALNRPELPARTEVGQRMVHKDGKDVSEKVFDEPTPEQRRLAWVGKIASNPLTFDLNPLRDDDLTIHEWGVFTVFNDVKYANVNRAAEWSALPEFFYRQFPRQHIKWVPGAWDKPIVYFYSHRPLMKVHLKVKFADGGAPVAWWPCASEPVNRGVGREGQKQAIPLFDSLGWDLWLGDRAPMGRGIFQMNGTSWSKAKPHDMPAGSWLTSARLGDAALLTADSWPGRGPRMGGQFESERFIFYDGLMPAPDFLRCGELGAGAVTLKNAASFDMPHVYVIDRRGGATSAATIALSAGREARAQLSAADSGMIERSVRVDLLHAGLFEAEADSLLKIWHQGLFENKGVVAFYVLPSAQYERMLPMEVDPTPAHAPVRVGIAFHPNLEADPEISQRMAPLIRQLDDVDYHKRDQAMKTIVDIGPDAIRPLTWAKATASVNARLLIDDALQQIGAVQWMTATPTPAESVKPAGRD
jgi:hypothetical protein